MQFLSPSFSASSLSLASRSLSSLQNTTKEPILQDLLAAVAASIFLTRLVKLLSISRAKIIATGFPPFCQTKQFFLPADEPLMLRGWNGPGIDSPVCGPDFNSAPNAPLATSAPATTVASRD